MKRFVSFLIPSAFLILLSLLQTIFNMFFRFEGDNFYDNIIVKYMYIHYLYILGRDLRRQLKLNKKMILMLVILVLQIFNYQAKEYSLYKFIMSNTNLYYYLPTIIYLVVSELILSNTDIF
jgi:hypothetical protein